MVCSSAHLKEEFDRIRRSVLMRPRDRQQLASEVVEMRNKMRETLGSKPGSGQFHLKQDAGGLVDIEFIAQYGALLCAAEHESVLHSTATRKILLKLADCGVLSTQQADTLFQAYRQYRELSHQLALQEHSSKIDDSLLTDTRQQVQTIWQDVLHQHAAADRA
jgi:glutamate-ammonia-ligase adenylyltransferase